MLPATGFQYLMPILSSTSWSDEGSQIPVWDVVGVIARGKTPAVVGDQNSCHRTNFFNKFIGFRSKRPLAKNRSRTLKAFLTSVWRRYEPAEPAMALPQPT
jgi:hypothetical protein